MPKPNLTITVRHLQRGQPRPYADHIYESRIIVTGERSWDRLTEDQIRHVVHAVVHPYRDESVPGYFVPRLKSLRHVSTAQLTEHKLGPREEVWIARVEEPYTD